jgi:hypothetical protein
MTRLLRQDRELREVGAWNWTLPALGAKLDDGRTIHTCPQAGACAALCYARSGIVANNIPHFKKKQGAATFGDLQRARI